VCNSPASVQTTTPVHLGTAERSSAPTADPASPETFSSKGESLILQSQEKKGQTRAGVRTPRDGICTPPLKKLILTSLALLLHGVFELSLALFLQQVIESFGLRVRLLLQNRLVGFQDAFHGG
jgi:hypothetical protein